jgi:cell fate regulator YaaT (PSP1 superfamily)
LATYGKPRFLGIVSLSDEVYNLVKRERLIVITSHRGMELAEIVGPLDEEQEKEYRLLRTISEHGEGPVRGGEPVVTDLEFSRVPLETDIAGREAQVKSEDEILRAAQELVEMHHLSIKLIDAEALLDEKKLFFYFTSDQRVDFRMLVKDLARRFKTRIELRQMGVRDEARIIRGISSCGLPCCCSYWLNQFAPIGIKMVKEQNIALNPAKISGICGRLMCCMSFEHRVYKDLWAGLPGPGSKIKTPLGNYIVISMDISKEAVRCHKPSGGDVAVPIEMFTEFKDAVMSGKEWEAPEPVTPNVCPGKKAHCAAGKGGLFDKLAGRIAASEGDPATAEIHGSRAEDAGPPKDVSELEAKSAVGADRAAETGGNRSRRKRSRRGVRKQQEETISSLAGGPQDIRVIRLPAQMKRAQAQRPQIKGSFAAAKVGTALDRAETEKIKRPRRRRRRQKRPGAEGIAT